MFLREYFKNSDSKRISNHDSVSDFISVAFVTAITYAASILILSLFLRLLEIDNWFMNHPNFYYLAFLIGAICVYVVKELRNDNASIAKLMILPVLTCTTLIHSYAYWPFLILTAMCLFYMFYVDPELTHEKYLMMIMLAPIISLILYLLIAIFYIGFSYDNYIHLIIGNALAFLYPLSYGRSLVFARTVVDRKEYKSLPPQLIIDAYNKPSETGYICANNVFLTSFIFLGEFMGEVESTDAKRK